MGMWRTYWTKCRVVTSVSSWDMTSVTKRWSLPARTRSTPGYTHATPSWTKKGRASFNDCNYTESMTRFVTNCMNSSGSVLNTCLLRMFHTTQPRRNVDVHCNASYPTQKDPCCSATKPMMIKTFHSCSWPDFTTRWDIKVRATNWSRNTCHVRVQHVCSELCLQASKLRREFLRLREHVFTATQDHDQRIEEHLLEYELWHYVFARLYAIFASKSPKTRRARCIKLCVSVLCPCNVWRVVLSRQIVSQTR